jgi:hypothetical protein
MFLNTLTFSYENRVLQQAASVSTVLSLMALQGSGCSSYPQFVPLQLAI